MARPSLAGIKEKIDGIFPLKTFVLSLTALLLLFVMTIGATKLFSAPAVDMSPTGKTMAMVDIATPIVDEPIKTVVPDEAHEPATSPEHVEEHVTEHGEDAHTAEPAHPLDTPPPEGTDAVKPTPVPEPPALVIPDTVDDLSEKSSYGPLPTVRDDDNLTSFEAYKAPFSLKSDTKGIIALVMVDYGLSDKMSEAAIEHLPSLTTLVASPYAEDLQPKIKNAHSKLMEVWLNLPMQGDTNSGASTVGQDAILTGLNTKENTARLKTNLGRATGYAGVAITVKPTFAENSPDLQSIINAISLRGLGITQLETTDTSIDTAASQASASFVNGDLWLDDVLTASAITQKLADAEKLALSNGLAVVSFHPSQLTINTIGKWQQSLAAQKIQLAPLTYAVKIDGPAPKNSDAVEKPAEAVKEAPKEPPKEDHKEPSKEAAPHGKH